MELNIRSDSKVSNTETVCQHGDIYITPGGESIEKLYLYGVPSK